MLVFSTVIRFIALSSYLVLALLTLRSRADRSVRTSFVVYISGMLFWQFASLIVSLSHSPEVALVWYNLLVTGVGVYSILFFPFTRALLGIKGQKRLSLLAYVGCALVLAGGILGMQIPGVEIGLGGYFVPEMGDPALYATVGIFFFFWGYSLFNLIRGLVREKSPVQRNRITYILIGALVVTVGGASNFTVLQNYPVDITLNLVSALIIGYAVVRYKLLDIRFILIRSLFYSILTAALIAAYLGTVVALESVLKERIGYSGPVYGIIAIVLLAVVFLPLRNLLQKLLDKLFFREKADYQAATQGFSRDVVSLYDAEAILSLTGSTIVQAVKIRELVILVLDEEKRIFLPLARFPSGRAEETMCAVDSRSPLAHWLQAGGRPLVREEAMVDLHTRALIKENEMLFETMDVSIIVPVMLRNKLIGMMNVGPKLSGTMYNDDDLQFLLTIANQAATAMEKSDIFREMERRLSEQTLLFILSEKFRSSSDFDSAMMTVVQILKNFLRCDSCAIVFFQKDEGPRKYALDPLGQKAAELAVMMQAQAHSQTALRRDALPIDIRTVRDLAAKAAAGADERDALTSLIYFPLQSGTESIGMLIIPNRLGGEAVDARELELLRTIRAIVSQGIILYRTIMNLMSLKTYNENILNSLNDMGDTLVILDLTGVIRNVNKATCSRLGYTSEELVGRPVSLITGNEERLFTPDGLAELAASGSISNYEMSYKAKSGATVPMLFSGSVMTGEDGKRREIVGIARDITEHIKAEEMTKNMLLIKEIHHRIKNNLQVISSLLYLQSGYVQDEKTKEMFRESQNRVRSMALLHEKLYQSRTPAGIAFAEYIKDLTRNLFMSYGEQAAAVSLSVEIGEVTLGMDTAVPCGLIVNELVSNALKHAFSPTRSGEISIVMAPAPSPQGHIGSEKWYTLVVSDDGRGFPEGLDFRATDSLGLKLVCTLTDQLKGTIALENGGGTRFTIRFREI